jgi:thioredoxin 1
VNPPQWPHWPVAGIEILLGGPWDLCYRFPSSSLMKQAGWLRKRSLGGPSGAPPRQAKSTSPTFFMSQSVIAVSDASFEADVLKSDVPVLVDFWAEWCGPCKMIGPIVEDIAGEYKGRLKVVKLNVDENAAIPAKHGIRGIPTLILFKNGAAVSQKVGAAAKSQLTAWIDSNL